MTDGRQKLDELFAAKQDEMLAVLQGVRSVVDHPTMKGTASEKNWRTLLGQYLPERYRIESGKVIDSNGVQSDQIDVIILDQQYSPLLFESGDQKYFPAESVYAVFEVKQVLDKENLEYASAKASSVRGLHRTSAPVVHAGGEFESRNPFRIIAGILATESAWVPPFGEKLESVVGDLATDGQIDLGCALGHGSFLVDYSPGEGQSITVHPVERSLVGFVFELLSSLQRLGTVPAIDYKEYLD